MKEFKVSGLRTPTMIAWQEYVKNNTEYFYPTTYADGEWSPPVAIKINPGKLGIHATQEPCVRVSFGVSNSLGDATINLSKEEAVTLAAMFNKVASAISEEKLQAFYE